MAAQPAPPRSSPEGPLPRRTKAVSVALLTATVALVTVGGLLIHRAESRTNRIALAASPKPVTVTLAEDRPYQLERTYVGTLEPWLSANVGPQLISAYVDTVLVRPGAAVKRGDVLATLDCRDANAATQAVAMEARALDARRAALASESARLSTLLEGKFVSPNEAEQKAALSKAEEARLLSMNAKLTRQALEVNDCILRAPFDGEIATRSIDPGAFVRPGVAIVSVVDRSTVRFTADVPEVDFEAVEKGRKVRVDITATRRSVVAAIERRSPAADPSTRTVHFEIDITDPGRTIPVGTTGEAHLPVGEPVPATEIPAYAAIVHGKRATVFVVEGEVAHSRTVTLQGEIAGRLFVSPDLPPGSQVVTEGRALLMDGDRVSPRVDPTGREPHGSATSSADPRKDAK